MSDQKQPFNSDEALQKAKDYARDNPDSARSAIDKVEDFLDQRTGGKFTDAIEKGGDFLEEKLGLPNSGGAQADSSRDQAPSLPQESSAPEQNTPEQSSPEPTAPEQSTSEPGTFEPSTPEPGEPDQSAPQSQDREQANPSIDLGPGSDAPR